MTGYSLFRKSLNAIESERRVLFICGNYFQPVAVGVVYEINAHSGIFETYTAHLFVQSVRGGVVVGHESEMEFVVAEIVSAVKVFQPRKLKLKTAVYAFEIHYRERAVFSVYPARFFKSERLAVKLYRSVEVSYVVVFVNGSEFHFFILRKQL